MASNMTTLSFELIRYIVKVHAAGFEKTDYPIVRDK